MAGAVGSEEGKSRRDVLKALGAAAAGAVAGGVLKAEDAEAGHGIINASSNTDRPAIHAENTGDDGAAIEAVATSGTGGLGISVSSAETGVRIRSYGVGIDVLSQDNDGIRGSSLSETGVEGVGPTGVVGRGTAYDGVVGSTVAPGGVGVRAAAGTDTATALQVEGRAKFSTAASGTIPTGQDSASINTPAVTALSHITVTLTGDPGQAGSAPGSKPVVVWVERQPGTGFVVHMSRPVRFATPFTYLVVEPA